MNERRELFLCQDRIGMMESTYPRCKMKFQLHVKGRRRAYLKLRVLSMGMVPRAESPI